MRSPLILIDGYDVTLYDAQSSVERDLEREDVVSGRFLLFDADGRRLWIQATTPSWGRTGVLVSVSENVLPEPNRLFELLDRALKQVGVETTGMHLNDVVSAAVAAFGMTSMRR